MTQASTAKRMQEITELIHGHNARYLGTPTIGDENFDALVNELATGGQLSRIAGPCSPLRITATH